MATMNKIGYKLVKNMTETAEKAPYTGMAIPVGSLAYDNILSAMIGSGTFMSRSTAKYFLDAFFEYCAEAIASDVVRISTGTVSVYPAISGSFPSEDAEFDPLKNRLYIAAGLSQDLRDAVGGIQPAYAGEAAATGSVKISSVMDIETETFKVIRGTKPFRIAGINLTVPDGADESLALYDTSLVAKVCDIVTSETDGGQRIKCQLPGSMAIPKGAYKIRLASHGIDPTDPLAVVTYSVTLAEDVVPVPAITKIKEGVRPDNNVGFGSDPTVLTGVFPGGHKQGDVLRLDSIYDGGVVHATMTLDAFVTASTETTITLGAGFSNESESPDSEWNGHTAKVTLVRDGTEYSHTFAFSAA